MRELGITVQQAAGIVGNFGAESGLISGRQEGTKESDRPLTTILGRTGGIDWAQWTADRRRAFAKFVEEKGLPFPSYETSLAFVLHELRGPEAKALRQLKLTTTAKAAAETFEHFYERAGVKNYPARIAYANRAVQLWLASPYNTGQPTPEPVPVPLPLPDPPKPAITSKTIIFAVLTFLLPLAGQYLPTLASIPPDTQAALISELLGLGGGAIAVVATIFGRIWAKSPIAGTAAAKKAAEVMDMAVEAPSPTFQLPPIEEEIAEAVRDIRSEPRLVEMSLETLVEQLPEVLALFRKLREETAGIPQKDDEHA
jgi:hypothetical protein